ncbi:SCO family protein [Litoreibacter roseus]|uniref:Protein senC n=1 Tax=Litoreibacter roseus TaxID=2601869 RepID=A0A6N6JHL9_9RHOB|nr:SCO family protein [Litoreibacter roseus]GFE64778.1 protein senC [Litoreibacter roseus]
MKLYATVAAGAVVAMVVGLGAYVMLAGNGDDQFAQCSQATTAGGDIGGPFELVSEDGTTVTDEDILTKPTLVYFGYTYCPDVCPLDAARNAEAVDQLIGGGYDVQPVFISIDPNRDTPEVLTEFTDVMHPDMIGLTGSPEQVQAASQAYRTYYKRQPGEDDYYLVDHSTLTYLMLPEHGFVDFFRRDATAPQIAETVACYVNAS